LYQIRYRTTRNFEQGKFPKKENEVGGLRIKSDTEQGKRDRKKELGNRNRIRKRKNPEPETEKG
jgi:hypothetical protein